MPKASAELTSGTGFVFEASVAAYYLTALLCENTAAGLGHRIVTCVSLQQGVNGEPLDDVIVDATAHDVCRLRLQAKRTLRATQGHDDFCAVVVAALDSIKLPTFRAGVDRVGGVTEFMSDNHYRKVMLVCDRARGVSTSKEFFDGLTSEQQHETVAIFRHIVAAKIGTVADDALFDLLRHFVVIKLSLMGEANTHTIECINTLRGALKDAEPTAAPRLWDRLEKVARQKAAVNAIVVRPQLCLELAADFSFHPSRTFATAINTLNQEGRSALADIRDEISGFHVDRRDTLKRIFNAIPSKKLILLHGQPGCGKSAILKSLVEQGLESVPLVLLKSDRVSGASWNQYASNLGILSADLPRLVSELVVQGVKTFFIDGLDRMGMQERNIVVDLVNAIIAVPRDDLSIVATLRDSGREALNDWLPRHALSSVASEYVSVGELTDDEADQLGEHIPKLRPLLFAHGRVRDIVRRPFFLALLAQDKQIVLDAGQYSEFTEVDLMLRWWRKAGASVVESDVIARQNTLIEIASSVATQMGWQTSQSRLSITGVTTVPYLISDGLIQRAATNRLKFAHDIFFDWSYVQYLADAELDAVEALLLARQPPALGRCIELLSQLTLKMVPMNWPRFISAMTDGRLRSQWLRCWFLGGFSSSPELGASDVLQVALLGDDGQNLRRTLVWLQAERTQPNPIVLANNPSKLNHELLQVQADLLSIPSDPRLWKNIFWWVLERSTKLPKAAIPALLQCFDVWQNVMADHTNAFSERIIGQSLSWLQELEDLDNSPFQDRLNADWSKLGHAEVEEVERQLRQLVLRASRAYVETVRQYLSRFNKKDRHSRHAYDDIQRFSPILAEQLPNELRDVTLSTLLEPLPFEHFEAELKREHKMRAEAERVRSIPPEKRTQLDELTLGNVFLGPSLPPDVRHSLCIEDHGYGHYFPASPLREPFASLLSLSPEVGLDLVHRMSNHSIEAWQQLCEIKRYEYGTPIPIRLDFPWGNQEFWGDANDYAWHRGHGASYTLCSALMALESWAHRQIDAGRDRDEVLEKVLKGNKSLSVLGIALGVCLEHGEPTVVSLRLATCQRLWALDGQRLVHDMSPSNMTGFGGFGRHHVDDAQHVEAVKELNARQCRKQQIHQLFASHFFCNDVALGDKAKAAVLGFPMDLPYTTEEQRLDPAATSRMLGQAAIWAELAKNDNYSRTKIDDRPGVVMLEHDNPKLREPNIVAQGERAQRYLTISNIAVWARKCIEHQSTPEPQKLAECVQVVRALEKSEHLSEKTDVMDVTNAWGAAIGVASLCTIHREGIDQDLLHWAESIVERFYTLCTSSEGIAEHGPMSLWHPSEAVVHAHLSMLSTSPNARELSRRLLRMVAQQNVEEALQTVKLLFARWKEHPRLCIAVLDVSSRLACIPPRFAFEPRENAGDVEAHHDASGLIDSSIALLESNADQPTIFVPPLRRAPTTCSDEPTLTDDDVHWFDIAVGEVGYWHLDFLSKILRSAPLVDLSLHSHFQTTVDEFNERLLAWTQSRFAVGDAGTQRRRKNDYNQSVGDWLDALGWCLGNSALTRSAEEADQTLLRPVLHFPKDARTKALSAFVRRVVCAIHDEEQFPAQAASLLDQCARSMIAHGMFAKTWRDDAQIDDRDTTEILRDFFLVSIERADQATRFSNGKWSDLSRLLPMIEKLVDSVGWSISAAINFISLAERAKLFYPTDVFARHALRLVTFDAGNGWLNTNLPRRLASLVQLHAEHGQLNDASRERLLRVLDCLVDLGDRRSAALQLTPAFVDVRISATYSVD